MVAIIRISVIICRSSYREIQMSEVVRTVFIPSSLESKSGMFGGEKPTDIVDGNSLAIEIQKACNDLVDSGYQVTQVMPVSSGGNNYKNGVGYGYGFSYTSGVIIVATNKVPT